MKARIQRTRRGIVLASALTIAAMAFLFAAMSTSSETATVTSNEPQQGSVAR